VTGRLRRALAVLYVAKGRPFGAVIVLLVATAQFLDPAPLQIVRTAWFDLCQFLAPREPTVLPAVIVDIDEAALAAYGQWPWPRTRVAQLIRRVAASSPAAIGLDIVFAEPDQTSPAQMIEAWPELDAGTRERLRALPSNDQTLAQAIADAGVVVGKAAYVNTAGGAAAVGGFARVRERGDWRREELTSFNQIVGNIAPVEKSAAGWGLLAAMPTSDGVVRRALAFGRAGPTVLAGLPLEMIRTYYGAPGYVLESDGRGRLRTTIGDIAVHVDTDGGLNLHHARHDPRRFLSAKTVLDSEGPVDYLRDRLAIIAVTALGLRDFVDTPTQQLMPGAEIHVQVLESILQNALLERPRWAGSVELVIALAAGALLIWLVPILRPGLSFVPLIVLWGALLTASWGLFTRGQILFDPTGAGLASGITFVAMLGITLVLAEQRRRELQADLEREQRAAQILQGELNAARDIQMGILPRPETANLPASVDLAARLVPAKTVGGDLYDFFMIDEKRLFFHIGDVTGKGVDAALFMALSKALCKSVVLRQAADIDLLMAQANREIARENIAEMMVTMFAGVLDLETGEIEFCNAGHESPYRLRAGAAPEEVESEGGPPLCALDDFPYPLERTRLGEGEMLVLYTDGVTDARNPADEMFGRVRLAELFVGTDPAAGAQAALNRLYESVDGFVAGADAADDITVLVLRRMPPA
jgi:serine phosphatase RsbU (regulator of sigma subunit)/CHASE2 domain-containing sensor protein